MATEARWKVFRILVAAGVIDTKGPPWDDNILNVAGQVFIGMAADAQTEMQEEQEEKRKAQDESPKNPKDKGPGNPPGDQKTNDQKPKEP